MKEAAADAADREISVNYMVNAKGGSRTDGDAPWNAPGRRYHSQDVVMRTAQKMIRLSPTQRLGETFKKCEILWVNVQKV
jgi:hypothetical protein